MGIIQTYDDELEALTKLMNLSPAKQLKQYIIRYQYLNDSMQTARNAAKLPVNFTQEIYFCILVYNSGFLFDNSSFLPDSFSFLFHWNSMLHAVFAWSDVTNSSW